MLPPCTCPIQRIITETKTVIVKRCADCTKLHFYRLQELDQESVHAEKIIGVTPAGNVPSESDKSDRSDPSDSKMPAADLPQSHDS
jgi:hypothetical protein